MTQAPAAVLIVDRDHAQVVATEAVARGYDATVASTASAALELLEQRPFDALLVDLAAEAEGAFELLERVRAVSPDTELIVLSDRTPSSAAIHWNDPDALTFARKSDTIQLFALLAQSLERRRIAVQNRRLVWELQTINDISSVLTKSLELDEAVGGALQRLVTAMEASGGSIQLRDESTGVYETQVVIGAPPLRRVLTGRAPGVRRPSDDVIATRAAVIVDDLAGLDDRIDALPLRSAIALPMLAGSELLGTLTLASMKPRRFDAADQQWLAIIAGQMVIAIENAQLHDSIRRAKREWEQTFDAISDPIAVFNEEGELLRGNRALAAHLCLPVTAIRRLTCRQVGFCGGAETCAGCAVSRALAQQEARGEITLADGQIFSVTTFPIGLPSKGPSVVQIAKNVTEEMRGARRLQQMSTELAATNERLVLALEQLTSAQAQVLQSEKLSAIGQLVSGVAHELNNPLTSVIGYAQLAEEELRARPGERPASELADDMRRIADESERAARIVRNLLAFARRHSGARAPLDLLDVFSGVLASRQQELTKGDVEVRVQFDPNLPRVVADAGQLRQVLLNLILNAEQAMRVGGTRCLTLGAWRDPEAGAVELLVADSGHGIGPADLPRIFDPFFTTRDVGDGTGLGLSICYGIVRDHGGSIRVESQLQAGTTFVVTLPAISEEPGVRDTEVLVAHAEPGEREFISSILGGWGYPTVLASTLREALDVYGRSTLGIAIVDARLLAEDLPAWRLARAAREGPRVPMVLTSMQPDGPAVARFGEEEAVAVLGVPIELRALRAAVRMSVKECV